MDSRERENEIKFLADALYRMARYEMPNDMRDGIDVRFYIRPSGLTEIFFGPADYDTDHRGVCSAGTLTNDMDVSEFSEMATVMVDEALDSLAETA